MEAQDSDSEDIRSIEGDTASMGSTEDCAETGVEMSCIVRLHNNANACVQLHNFRDVESESWLRDILVQFGGACCDGTGGLPAQVNVLLRLTGSLMKLLWHKLRAGKTINLGASSHCFVNLNQSDDSGEGLLMLLVHLCCGPGYVPKYIGLRLLRDTCIVIDKYKLHQQAKWLTRVWCPIVPARLIPQRYKMEEIKAGLCIGHILRRSNVMERAMENAIRFGKGKLEMANLRFPKTLPEKINQAQRRIVENLNDNLKSLCDRYLHAKTPICPRGGIVCDSTAYGMLVKKLLKSRDFGKGDVLTSVADAVCLQDALLELRSLGTGLPRYCWAANARCLTFHTDIDDDMHSAIQHIISRCTRELNEVVADLMLEWIDCGQEELVYADVDGTEIGDSGVLL